MNGHPRFYELTKQENELHDKKNHDYASGGDPLGNFKRVSAIKRNYPKMDWASPEGTALDYMLKQLDAALWLMSQGHEAKCEGVPQRLQDISVYVKLAQVLYEEGQWAGVHPLSHPTDRDGYHL